MELGEEDEELDAEPLVWPESIPQQQPQEQPVEVAK